MLDVPIKRKQNSIEQSLQKLFNKSQNKYFIFTFLTQIQTFSTHKMSSSERSSSEGSTAERSSTDTSTLNSSQSSYSYYEEDTLFSMKTMSYICLCSCAGWALYNTSYRTCAYLYVSSGIILCYGLLGFFREHSRHIDKLFWHFRVLATIIPIGSINAHMFICDSDSSKFNILAALVTIPLLLKVVYPDRNQRILDIIVFSNVHTVGLKALEHPFLLGLTTSFWKTFYYLVTQNSQVWVQTGPEIPFNVGLSGMCWCIFIINIFHNETSKV